MNGFITLTRKFKRIGVPGNTLKGKENLDEYIVIHKNSPHQTILHSLISI